MLRLSLKEMYKSAAIWQLIFTILKFLNKIIL